MELELRILAPSPWELYRMHGGREVEGSAGAAPRGAAPHRGARPRVLVFAYACQPGHGSEPAAGWGLVRAMSTFADCEVLVGPDHLEGLRRWQAEHETPALRVVGVPEPGWARFAKRHRVTWFLLYLAWLRRAADAGRRLHAAQPFDVTAHATYSTYWLPSPAVRLGIPCVWGPVGGAVITPLGLWPLLGARGVAGELLDAVGVLAMASLAATRRTWRAAAVRLVQNEATRRRLPAPMQASARVLNHALFTEPPRPAPRERQRHLLYLGALEPRKGARLAIRALAHTPESVRLVVVGGGPDRAALERLARRLRVSARVDFRGRVPHDQVSTLMAEAAGVVFTGLREEGGIALAEAMLCGAPVIVLAHGGAATLASLAVDPSRVALVAPGRVAETARRMGAAMTRFSERPSAGRSPLLDQAAAVRALADAVAEALAHRVAPRAPGPVTDAAAWASR